MLESGGDEASGAPLWVDGEEVGIVTQAVVSPFLGGKTLGLAKIRKDLRQEGQGVVAQVGDEQVAGEVAQHPVYDKEQAGEGELAAAKVDARRERVPHRGRVDHRRHDDRVVQAAPASRCARRPAA